MSVLGVFREGIVLRIAFTDLVRHVCVAGTDPDDVDLAVVLAGLDGFGADRFAALLFAFKQAESIADALVLAQEVESWLRAGRRPRPLPALLSPEERSAVEAAFARRARADG